MLCDLCHKRTATLCDRTLVNNGIAEYHFCADCYKAIMQAGRTAFDVMQEVHARKGKECPACGTTAEDFRTGFMFGCPECYRNMREVAVAAAEATQNSSTHVGKRPKGVRTGR